MHCDTPAERAEIALHAHTYATIGWHRAVAHLAWALTVGGETPEYIAECREAMARAAADVAHAADIYARMLTEVNEELAECEREHISEQK